MSNREVIDEYVRQVSNYIGGIVNTGKGVVSVVPCSGFENECYENLDDMMSTFSFGSCEKKDNGVITLTFNSESLAECFNI